MRVLAAAVFAFAMVARMAGAQEVQVTFSLPPEHGALGVSWAATPMNLPADADVLQAMVMEPETRPGPWTVTLEPGPYIVSAFSEADLFELEVTITAETQQAYEVPALSFSAVIPYRCADQDLCAFQDPATGLAFSLPRGWAAEEPYRFDEGDGTVATSVSAVFFQDTDGDGADVWFLNPPEWEVDENGPCRDVPLGALCTFDLTAGAEAAFAVLSPSLQISAAP